MQEKDNLLKVNLLNQELIINCPPLLQEKLAQAAKRLEKRLKQIKSTKHAWDRDEILGITAVNMMFEMMELEQEFAGYKRAITKRANSILKTIDAVIGEEETVE